MFQKSVYIRNFNETWTHISPYILQLEKSVQGHVFLKNADMETEGLYRCEASAESPTFQTVAGEKQLKIFGKFIQNC